MRGVALDLVAQRVDVAGAAREGALCRGERIGRAGEGLGAFDALRAATLNGARTAGLDGRVGALKPGMAADLSIIDLRDPSFVPHNSAARLLVFTESGRAVEEVAAEESEEGS